MPRADDAELPRAPRARVTMPWCATCERDVPKEEVTDAGTCPTCDRPLEERRKVPWHFKLLLVATVIYLGWRAYQGIGWLVHHL